MSLCNVELERVEYILFDDTFYVEFRYSSLLEYCLIEVSISIIIDEYEK